MKRTFKEGEHPPMLRVLALLFEQKVVSVAQVYHGCFGEFSKWYVYKVLERAEKDGLIESRNLMRFGQQPIRVYSLSKSGFSELKAMTGLELERAQLLSPTPPHDLGVTELRLTFSRIRECKNIISENLLRTKLLEESLSDLVFLRASNVDMAVELEINQKMIWMGVEFEQSGKSDVRYEKKFKHWYQSEGLKGILLIVDGELLLNRLKRLDAKTYPNLPRKVLFARFEEVISATEKVRFETALGEPLILSMGKSVNMKYPILDQSLAIY